MTKHTTVRTGRKQVFGTVLCVVIAISLFGVTVYMAVSAVGRLGLVGHQVTMRVTDCEASAPATTSRGGGHPYNLRATEQLKGFAATKGVATAQLALAWLLHQGEDVVPIPGTRSALRLEENAGAAEVDLTGADLAQIAEILPHGSAGSRYPAEILVGFTTD